MLLRSFNKDDLDPFAEIVADSEVIRQATYTEEPMTQTQVWNRLCLMIGHWHRRESGIWAVEEQRSNALIDRIGLQLLDWFNDVELVWMLVRSSWSMG